MEWEDKIKLVTLGNQRHNSPEAKEQYQQFVLDNYKSFDEQAWDMLCELTDIIPAEMKANAEYWTTLYEYLKNVEGEKFGFRALLRLEVITNICREIVN